MTKFNANKFFSEAEQVLARAKEGLAHVEEDYPMLVLEAISLASGGVEVDGFVDGESTVDAVGREGAPEAMEMVVGQINETLKQYKGRVRVGGMYKGSLTFGIVFNS